jgi:hypothetical protein
MKSYFTFANINSENGLKKFKFFIRILSAFLDSKDVRNLKVGSEFQDLWQKDEVKFLMFTLDSDNLFNRVSVLTEKELTEEKKNPELPFPDTTHSYVYLEWTMFVPLLCVHLVGRYNLDRISSLVSHTRLKQVNNRMEKAKRKQKTN